MNKKQLKAQAIKKNITSLKKEIEIFEELKIEKAKSINKAQSELDKVNTNLQNLKAKLDVIEKTLNDDLFISFTKHLFQTKHYLVKYFRVWNSKKSCYQYCSIVIKNNGEVFISTRSHILKSDNMKDHMLGYTERSLVKAVKPWGKMKEVFNIVKPLIAKYDLDDSNVNGLLSLTIGTLLEKEIKSFVEHQKK